MAIITKQVKEKDKILVREYFCLFHKGFNNRAPREEISPKLNMTDRRFRDICAEIPQIITNTEHGYWYVSDRPTEAEIEAIKGTLKQDQARLVSLYRRHRERRRLYNHLMRNRESDLFGGF